MSNLFSVFDPQTAQGLPLNWLSSVLIISVLPCVFWISPAQPQNCLKGVFSALHFEFAAMLGSSSSPGLSLLPIALFGFIVLNNFFGLFPYIFTSSSHLTFTVALALPLWLGHMIMGWLKTPQSMLAHLVPLGTPPALMPLMVLIELTSSVIRPLTLAVRLAANMVAGHLLLTLLSGQASSLGALPLMGLLVALILLATLETAVSLIQAYVFSVLSTLYFNEINSPVLSA